MRASSMRFPAIFSLFFLVGCQQMFSAPADHRVVYVTPNASRGASVVCVEPSARTPDSYRQVFDIFVDTTTSVEKLPDQNLYKIGDFEKSIGVSEATRFIHNRSTRLHNMRELLFEICQAYATNLIDLPTYNIFLEKIVDRTTALHAMEILLYQLDRYTDDEDTQNRLIDLTEKIIFGVQFSRQNNDSILAPRAN